jgi:hypothetical protein
MTSQTGVRTSSASRKVVFFVIQLYFRSKNTTLCTTPSCIFKPHTIDFAGIGYTNLHSILCSVISTKMQRLRQATTIYYIGSISMIMYMYDTRIIIEAHDRRSLMKLL